MKPRRQSKGTKLCLPALRQHRVSSTTFQSSCMKRILITGGAGFIGSHVADLMLASGYEIRILDNLNAQVHGETAQRPAYLAKDAELIVGDVRDRAAVE